VGIEQIPWNVRTLINQKTLSDVMRGVLPSIRVVVSGVWMGAREKRKESFFSSGTSRPRVGFLARLESILWE